MLCTHASAVVLLLASVASSGRALDVTRAAAAPSSHLANNRFTSQEGGVARRHQRPLPPSKLAAQRQRRVVSDLQGQVASLQAQLAAAEAELVLIERDPPSSSPQHAAKRRTQTAARPGSQVCKRYEMGLRVSKINTRCCGRKNEHCSNGVPSRCDTGCASEVLAFWPRCHTVFPRATPARSVASFKRVLQLCRAAQARPHAFPANARALTVMNGRLSTSSQPPGGGPYVGVYTSQLQQLIDGSYASVMDADLRKVSLVDAKRLRHLVLFGACVDDDDGLWVCGGLSFFREADGDRGSIVVLVVIVGHAHACVQVTTWWTCRCGRRASSRSSCTARCSRRTT
eukprot:COSAG01_NODE_1095_length_11714_cov_9.062930_9_plen_342_part_00